MRVFILIITPQLCIGLHQGLFAEGILDLHLRLSSHINARLQDDLSKEAAKGEISIILISGLYHNNHNKLA
jgi:hypothetical protein